MMNEEKDLSLDGMESIELTDDELEEVSGGKKRIYVKVREANIRSGPGTEYPCIWGMGKGDELIYLGEKAKDRHGKTWVMVKAVATIGWIRADLVRK